MDYTSIIKYIEEKQGIRTVKSTEAYRDEVYIDVNEKDFAKACLGLHKKLNSPVVMFFALDERSRRNCFVIQCVFLSFECRKWFFVRTEISGESPEFDSLSRQIYSASLFEREIREMFGIEPRGNPDLRGLRLHEEVWPRGNYPLRKDFKAGQVKNEAGGEYKFARIEGEGVFEVPVGPVHAGIIGPGHFRFSVAGEPIINLELRLGFTHRGAEKLFEGKAPEEAFGLAERVSGDSCFAHGLAFCRAVEKIKGIAVPYKDELTRAVFLELERMYNHAADIGGMAVDVGFSFPSMYAAIIKEAILCLNDRLTQSRYLKGVNKIGGLSKSIDKEAEQFLSDSLKSLEKDFNELKKMLFNSVSFMDRVEGTGILRKKTASDLGVVGLAARASGIPVDLRRIFPGIYEKSGFNMVRKQEGDCLARLCVRIEEFEESIRLIRALTAKLDLKDGGAAGAGVLKHNFGLGYAEGWRGQVLYWVKLDEAGSIDRCKIVDPSFNNWQGLSFAVLGDIVPDFPLCNKSFDLSYSANDL
ncbi:MAG: NADH-quinone oxidoreductase subunit C [Candidatus Omnitrophica bacterium]|nr:NADH-quinone oxidoreductase subunit C [Candidatus Omnitrophota bacterium]